MLLAHFSLSRFGFSSIQNRKKPPSEGLVSAYEFEFYTDDYAGGTLTDGVFHPARKQHYCLYRPGQRQQLIPPYKCYFVNIVTQDPEFCEFFDQLPSNGLLWNIDAIVDLLREMMATQDKNTLASRLFLQSCACRILSLLASQRLPITSADHGAFLHREELMSADRYMRDNLTGDLSLAHLAELSNLDPTYFHKLYTSVYGKTPAQRALAYRITAAKMSLVDSDLPLNEIATRCGFSSQSYFTSKFKQAIGITPSQYRKKLLDEQKK
ncbi:MAG: helix-turn-helix transcriptional regulator [Oscillospiraceae bacterium]|nr:helix-turn-helix transcriptional regulator [Oscillospiraceae bacterium]